MSTIGNIFCLKKPNIFKCNLCDYECSYIRDYERHIVTKKHKNNELATNINESIPICPKYACNNCQKNFKERTGLWKHKKKCIQEIDATDKNDKPDKTDKTDKNDKDDLITLLLTQNKELINLLKSGIVNNINTTNTNNNHNTTNNAFNINVFLNETCKDAMNIGDFVSSIKVNLEELENTGRQGYIEGISSIILKRLNNLEHNFRPLHCSDSKREVFYIKDNNEWKKENEEKPILTKAIKVIANENIKQIKHWRDKYPDCTDSDSKKNNLYLKIVSNSMNGSTAEESIKNIDKIISNVAKKVIIDKTNI